MKKLLFTVIIILTLSNLIAVDQVLPDRSLDMANEMIYVGFKAAADSTNITELDNLYSHLVNTLNLENADEDTGEQIKDLLNTIESLRMLDIKRSRLDKIYDLRKSQLISSAIPNPVNLIGTVGMFAVNPVQGLTSLIGTAASSALMYKSASSALNLDMLQQDWELDDSERATLHTNTTELVEYTRGLVNPYGIDVHKVMTEELVTRFIELTSADGRSEIQRAIGQLEFYQTRYESFSRYWLELADLYYRNEQFDKCLETIYYYENNFDYTEIYRYNYRYAQILIDGIGSIFNLFSDEIEIYSDQILEWLEIIEKNTQLDDWLQRYYCASIYLILSDYYPAGVQKAYELIKLNLEGLVETQNQTMYEYMQEIPDTADLTYAKEDVPEVEDYYEELSNIRKTELPPFDSAYQINLKMLYSILLTNSQIANRAEIDYLFEAINIPQLRAVFLKQPLSIDRSEFILEKDFTSSDFTLTLPAYMINNQTIFGVKILNLDDDISKEMLSSLKFDMIAIDSELSIEKTGLVEIRSVDRHKSSQKEDFTANIHFDIDNEVTKNYKNYGLAILINTADCPIVLYFAGSNPSKMVLVTAVKCLSLSSYYNNFESL